MTQIDFYIKHCRLCTEQFFFINKYHFNKKGINLKNSIFKNKINRDKTKF